MPGTEHVPAFAEIRTSANAFLCLVTPLVRDLDEVACDALRSVLAEAVDRATQLVVVDLLNVVFLDSSGLGCLVAARKRADAQGKGLRIVNASGGPRSVLHLTGLDTVFGVTDDVDPEHGPVDDVLSYLALTPADLR